MSDPSSAAAGAAEPFVPLAQAGDWPLLRADRSGAVAHVRLARPDKRNALSDALVLQLRACFEAMPDDVRAIVLSGEGEHFCAGLDLAELIERDAVQGMQHSRMWHATMDAVQFGRAPVIAVLHGATVGGGFELAASCHLRVAEPSTYFALPEGQRGLFVGGGGSVRIPRLIGVARMTDMMLTGRTLGAADAEAVGLVQYAVPAGEGVARGLALARRIATNARVSNLAVMHALPRIADLDQPHGLFMESLMAAVSSSAPEATARIREFLAGRAGRVTRS